MDVKSIFLNEKLKEEVYVKQPPAFESIEFPDYVCKLDKALYGLKQAPSAWYETLSTFLIQNKFIRGRIDNTLFIFKTKGDVLLIQVYVDDIIFGSINYKLYDKRISICQEEYTRGLLKKYGIFDSTSVKTPMVPPNNLDLDLSGKPVNETLYRGMIGYHANPKEPHLIVVKRIFKYLKGTPSLGMWYPKCSGFNLKGYSDSDYAEYVATVGSCANILWMKSQLSDYDIHYKMVPIFCDNTNAISMSNNHVLHSRTKHIDIRYHFIKDHILKGDIELHFIPTEY
ncbi:retrovirus-related pol polyprotein from transposon TNT 1-94 [Tanacetum coccineum]|uniref:Retrovirus-related pol polyprotein from transposon TNT 1-94 n=1 Tax=Tanacetum coccineum TaxID=301880 RepID=A0ABQ5D0Y5_9ASTR